MRLPGPAAGLIAGVAILASSCAGGSAQIDFSRLEPAATSAPAATPAAAVRMAVASVLTPSTSSALYAQLADYLAQRLGRPVEMVQGKTYAETNDMVKSGEVALALVCTNPYLEGREDFGMELLVAPEVKGETAYYSVLIVARDSAAQSLADLRGQSFAFTDPMSNTGRLAPLYQLAVLGQTPDSFFSRTTFTYAHDNSVRAVASGVVAGAAVDSLVFDYMQRAEPDAIAKVKVIERWGPYGISPIVVNPRLDAALKAELRSILLAMDEDSDGRAVLQGLGVDRFVVPDDSIYDSVREMRAFLRERGLGP